MYLHVRSLEVLLSQHLLLEIVGLDACHTQQPVTRMQSGSHTHACADMVMPVWGVGRAGMHMQETARMRAKARVRSCIMGLPLPPTTL